MKNTDEDVGYQEDEDEEEEEVERKKKLVHLASEKGFLDQLKSLTDEELKTKTSCGETGIHFAAKNGHTHIIDFLVNKGLIVDERTISNWTPLHTAVESNHLAVVECLLKHGADMQVLNSDGKSPMDIAKSLNNEKMMEAFDERATGKATFI